MRTLGRTSLLTMIPLNLILLLWVWFGRLVFGVGGWFLFIFVPMVLVVLVLLVLTTVLAYTQQGRPRALTGLQTAGQALTWTAMFGFGLFVPDFGDTEDSERSFLTQVFGWNRDLLSVSYTLALVFAAVFVVAYLLLLGSLTFGRRR